VLARSGAASKARISYQRAIESAQQMGTQMLEWRAADRLREMQTVGDARQKAVERSSWSLSNVRRTLGKPAEPVASLETA
jgi:hypothetical protein